MPDFTTYQPPGVYTEEAVTPLVSVVGVQPTVVAIVGPSLGYRRQTETLVLTGVATTPLRAQGINTASVVVTSPTGTVYPATAYSLTVAAGADGNIATTGDNTTTIARNGLGIPDGATVTVAYQYTDSTYFTPQLFTDFDDVVDVFGASLNLATNAVISPLSLAAKIFFENEGRNLLLVATPNATVLPADLVSAYAKLDTYPDVSVIVPLPVGITGTVAAPGDTATVGVDLRTYLTASANAGLLRTGFVGLEPSVTVDPAVTFANYRTARIGHVTPYRFSYFNGSTNTTFDVAGYYGAAACAGRAASQPAQVPLTKKDIRGFAGLPTSVRTAQTNTVKNALADAGAIVIEVSRLGSLQVRHGTSTDRTNVFTRELSLVRAKDALVNLIQDTMEGANLIGGFIDDTTTVRVQGVITNCLETALRNQIVVGYNDVKVRQLVGDPSIIEVKFQYRPAYPLNYIVVSFSVNTVTGETTALDLAA